MKEQLKAFLIFLSGFLTVFMQLFVPIAGGGVSLIFVLSVPILIFLGLVFSIVYYYFVLKIRNAILKNIIFIIMLILLLGLGFLYYPYA